MMTRSRNVRSLVVCWTGLHGAGRRTRRILIRVRNTYLSEHRGRDLGCADAGSRQTAHSR